MIVGTIIWANLGESFRAKRVEWCFTHFMLVWGVVLLAPADTFGISRSYAPMRMWAEEETWGIWFLMAGLVRLAILVVNGAWWRTAFFRAVAAFISIFFWASVSICIVLSGEMTTGLIYLVVLYYEASTMALAGKEAGTLERIALAKAQIPRTGWKGFILYVIGVEGRAHAAGGTD